MSDLVSYIPFILWGVVLIGALCHLFYLKGKRDALKWFLEMHRRVNRK